MSAALGSAEPAATSTDQETPASAPDANWPQKAVWYQIFPERFRNGDPKNDPTAEYARVPDQVRAKWRTTAWTKEWYAMDEWERKPLAICI